DVAPGFGEIPFGWIAFGKSHRDRKRWLVFSIRRGLFAAFLASSVIAMASPSSAETLQGALAKAYQNNSTLNSARAGVRITDEDVAIAKSGWRPAVGLSGSLGVSSQNSI